MMIHSHQPILKYRGSRDPRDICSNDKHSKKPKYFWRIQRGRIFYQSRFWRSAANMVSINTIASLNLKSCRSWFDSPKINKFSAQASKAMGWCPHCSGVYAYNRRMLVDLNGVLVRLKESADSGKTRWIRGRSWPFFAIPTPPAVTNDILLITN